MDIKFDWLILYPIKISFHFPLITEIARNLHFYINITSSLIVFSCFCILIPLASFYIPLYIFSLSFFISFSKKNTFSSTFFKSLPSYLSSTVFIPNHNHHANKFKTISKFVSYRHPVVSQIISSSKNLQTIPIRD